MLKKDLERITVRGESVADVVHPFVLYQEAARERFGTAITDAACQALGIDVEEVHRAIDDLHDFSYEEVTSDAEGEG